MDSPQRFRYDVSTMNAGAIIALAIAVVAAPRAAYAYLDPGTGSMILQIVVAGVAAAAFMVKTQWRAIKQRLFRRGDESEPPGSDPEADESEG